ncbi:MAG: DNA polymerase III subunit delta [Actinomycetales bacterium]|nr:DNA polymerase III subunit delta [Candidatus Lutibacillus vidarii]HRC00424.1 DNA polymerase III subunit delta [Dermatophilaceae bacterium]
MSDIPPLVLVRGPEELLADRAVAAVLADLKVEAPDLDVVRVGPDYHSGQLVMDTSPSLFGGSTCVVIEALHEASEDLHADLLDYLAAPAEHVTLVVRHAGGPRGKKVLDALVAGKARIFECPAVKSDRDKSDFVTNEFRRAGRKVTPEAVRALVEAVGKDLRELAASCAQLVVDTEGVVDDRVVETYHGGKVEATGFRVADAAVAGQAGEALRLLRHAIATGVDPVPIVAVLAGQLRQVVRVGSASRGASSAVLASSLGMAPWQVDKARRLASGWTPEGLATSIQAVAAADAEVKGGGRDPVYAVERAILTIAEARAAGRR